MDDRLRDCHAGGIDRCRRRPRARSAPYSGPRGGGTGVGEDRRRGVRRAARPHRAPAGPLRGAARLARAAPVRGRDRGDEPPCPDRRRRSSRSTARGRSAGPRGAWSAACASSSPGSCSSSCWRRSSSPDPRPTGSAGRARGPAPRSRPSRSMRGHASASRPGGAPRDPSAGAWWSGRRSAARPLRPSGPGWCWSCSGAAWPRSRCVGPPAAGALSGLSPAALVLAAGAATGGLGALAWTAFKVGALSYGGGFVIIPLMQSDAVERFGWMTDGEFLNAVALGQVTPGRWCTPSPSSATPRPGWAGRCSLRWWPSPRPSRSSSWAPTASTGWWRTATCAPSSTAPGPPRSGRSWARRSRSPSPWESRGRWRCWRARPWRSSSPGGGSWRPSSPRARIGAVAGLLGAPLPL